MGSCTAQASQQPAWDAQVDQTQEEVSGVEGGRNTFLLTTARAMTCSIQVNCKTALASPDPGVGWPAQQLLGKYRTCKQHSHALHQCMGETGLTNHPAY